MGYEAAHSKAWDDLKALTEKQDHAVSFLHDTYDVDIGKESVLSKFCNVPAKPSLAVLILHYLAKRLKGLPDTKGDWISFKELAGGEGYYPTFKKRVIDVVTRKYGEKPDTLFGLVERFNAKKIQIADISVALEAFEGVPLLITLWRGDEEFGPEANVLFDRSITDIFCTEDVTVFAETIAHSI